MILFVWFMWVLCFLSYMWWGVTTKWFIDATGLTPELVIVINDFNESIGTSL